MATIVLGPPASGKSTIANPIARNNSAAIIDVDEAKKIIRGYDGGIGANAVHVESSALGAELLEVAAAQGLNIVLPKVGGKAASIARLAETLKASGYRVEVVEVAVPPRTAVERMLGRFENTGRLIPPEVLAEGIDGAPKTYQFLKENNLADAYAKIDNSPALGQARVILENEGASLPELGRTRADRDGSAARDGRADQGAPGRAGNTRLDPTQIPDDPTVLISTQK